ncbi:uncharacterized protein LOC117640645 isoform X2 [Thrips palmi]|uniref:Uncharacterized protein LOC117640645 isoform X2 n=1 Tax=Thrips palmi TaxID=161013 RepID=A0A6P8YAL5_THRPL|nr:uncharacterized protein LOC117640645 isoform X2 [Thrips palmi]
MVDASSEMKYSQSVRMDALPDELLLEVLGRVDDGLTLLDAVPLVCRRWHRLSRDPGAWSSVTVHIKGCFHYEAKGGDEDEHDGHDVIQNAARILLHAPSLRCVEFDVAGYGSDRPSRCRFGEDLIPSAMGRCRADVREILLARPAFYNDTHDSSSAYSRPAGFCHLLDFVSRRVGHVRCLEIGYLLQAGTPFERALGQCENLEELHIMLPNRFQYGGELRGRRLPKLRRLTLEPWSVLRVEHCRLFLTDLVGCAAQSVRHIRCEGSSSSSEDVLAELPRCVELRSLHCGIEGAAVSMSLTRLRSLSLLIQFDTIGRSEQDQLRAWSATERALRASGELLSLRELRLAAASWLWDPNHRQAVWRVVTALGTRTPNVTNVSLGSILGEFFHDSVLGFLKSLPRLESVHIDAFPFHLLPRLAEVGGIKRVSGDVTWRSDGEGDLSCAAAELVEFQRRRPDIDCRLSVRRSYYLSS